MGIVQNLFSGIVHLAGLVILAWWAINNIENDAVRTIVIYSIVIIYVLARMIFRFRIPFVEK